jgi:glycosyltransferase involved in cell wall biosynthesis
LNSSATNEAQTESIPLLSVIMPAYNEGPIIAEILDKVAAIGIDKEIIIVDDCSNDQTPQSVRRFMDGHAATRVRMLRHERNMGKTAAVRSGLAAANGRIVVIQDADLEYDPGEFPRLVEPILSGRADAVYGSRFARGRNRSPGLVGRLHTLVNKFLTFVSNVATGLHLTDVETCYKVVRRDMLRNIEIRSTGFGFEVEITAKLARKGAKIVELPITYRRRAYDAGKKIGPRDGLAALWWIVRFALQT